MQCARSRARGLAEELASAWVAGNYERVSSACAPDVRWWTPATGDTVHGRTDAGSALRRALAPLVRPVAVTAVVPSDDGTRCVVEMRSSGSPPAFVTSVLTLHDGKVSAGRTYTDFREPDRSAEPEAS